MLTKFVSIGSYSPEVRTFGTLITSTRENPSEEVDWIVNPQRACARGLQ